LVVPSSIGTFDRIYFVVVFARALSSEVVAAVAPPIPTLSVIAVVGSTVISVVVAATTVISPGGLVGASRIVSD
jgi:hypothetical protein